MCGLKLINSCIGQTTIYGLRHIKRCPS